MKIKKGDVVAIISGEYAPEKGQPYKTGEVIKVYPTKNKVVVKGINLVTKHQRPSQENPDGGITKIEAPIHVSNVAYFDPVKKVPTKIGYKVEDGKKYRVAKKSGTVIDVVADYSKKAAVKAAKQAK